MKTKCIIVEDEPIAIDVIESHLKNFPEIEIISKCRNALTAFEILQKNNIDLMFLDINMPKLNGLDFLKTLTNPPKVIITTAYRKYALDGFEMNVVDYLLKPISLERFMRAIDKFHQLKKGSINQESINSPPAGTEEPYLYVRTNRKNVKIQFSDILFLESMKDYVVVHTLDDRIITKQLISSFDETLPKDLFIRIHRSYIVSISKISAVTKASIEIGKKELPISRNYKNIVFNRLKIN